MAYLQNEYARCGMVVVNVLIGAYVEERDRELFFGPLTEHDRFITAPDSCHISTLMARLGIYDSAKDAERHGWRGVIPEGFSDHLRVKKLHRVTILKITAH